MGDVGGATHTQMGLIREVDESPGAVKGSSGKKKQVKISEDKAAMDKQMKKIDSNLPPGRADLRRQADAKYTEEAEERGEEEAEEAEEPKPADG